MENIFTNKKIRIKILEYMYPICINCKTVKTQNNNKYCTWCGFQILRVNITNIKNKKK